MTVVKNSQHFLVGKVLLIMKNIDKKFMKIVQENVNYSRNYAYFQIDFYKQCVQFPRLKQARLQISLINKSWMFIKD